MNSTNSFSIMETYTSVFTSCICNDNTYSILNVQLQRSGDFPVGYLGMFVERYFLCISVQKLRQAHTSYS